VGPLLEPPPPVPDHAAGRRVAGSSLDHLLGQRGRQIPHAYRRVTGLTVEDLIKQVAAGLRREVFGSRALRLPRFTLLSRVLAADLGDADNPSRALNKELTKYYTLKPDPGGLVERVPSLLGTRP
jgi:hypothetical protein